jgi:hypothetical protein
MAYALQQLKFHTLRKSKYRLDALFLIQIYLGSKCYHSVLETAGRKRVPTRHIRDFSILNVCSSNKNCASAKCASADSSDCRDGDIFGNKTFSVHYVL